MTARPLLDAPYVASHGIRLAPTRHPRAVTAGSGASLTLQPILSGDPVLDRIGGAS